MNKGFFNSLSGMLSGWLVLLLPLCLLGLNSELLFPYVTSKVWLIRTCVLVGLSIVILSSQFSDRFRMLLTHPVFWVLLAYCAWGLISNQLSEEPQRAFWSTYERLEGGLGLIFGVLTTIYLYCALDTPKRQRNYLIAFIAVIIILATSGLISEHKRIHGLLGNPIYLGTTAGLGFFLVGFVQFRYGEEIRSSLWRQCGRVLCFILVLCC